MKEFLITILFLFNLPIYSQDTIPGTAIPLYAIEVQTFQSYFLDTFFVDFVIPDTIDNVLWSPVYHTSYNDATNAQESGFPKKVGHQRVVGEKVFFREENFFGIRQGLMYDYGVEGGDSIWVLAPQHPLLLDSILHVVDSVIFSNCSHEDSVRLVYTRALYDYPNREGVFYRDVWIEKAGSEFHSFFPVACIEEAGGSCEEFYAKQFAFIDGEWMDVRAIFCEEIPTSTSTINTQSLRTSIFPNPVDGSNFLTLRAGNYYIEEVFIYDITGRKMNYHSFGGLSEGTLDINGLQPGVYVVKSVSTRGGIQLLKAIVR